MNEREIKEKIENGHIHCRSIVEILGKPEKHVQDTLREYVQKMKENKNLILLKEDYSETKEQEEGLFSIFVELELLIKGVGEVVFFCFDYMPSSVEILEPEQLIYKNRELSAFLNDLQQRLHTYDMALKQFKARNERLMNENLILMKTAVLLSLSKEKMNKEKLITRTGLPEDRLEKLLSIMLKESRIIEEDGLYKLR
jgi:hypothetical protein